MRQLSTSVTGTSNTGRAAFVEPPTSNTQHEGLAQITGWKISSFLACPHIATRKKSFIHSTSVKTTRRVQIFVLPGRIPSRCTLLVSAVYLLDGANFLVGSMLHLTALRLPVPGPLRQKQ
ncbi:hypothetical protein LZ554_003633 [Drepanopeziza brunnea f. sp. 'monogermtubi']|nr:hypothetical protein LZ554_003633 [Drepanopeziza brunnea f. sp. 'monogermtubi']